MSKRDTIGYHNRKFKLHLSGVAANGEWSYALPPPNETAFSDRYSSQCWRSNAGEVYIAGKSTRHGDWAGENLQQGDVAVLKLEAELSVRVQRLGDLHRAHQRPARPPRVGVLPQQHRSRPAVSGRATRGVLRVEFANFSLFWQVQPNSTKFKSTFLAK